MKKKRLQFIRVVLFVMLFIAGVVITINSKKAVSSTTDNIVRQQYGGSMNTVTYRFYLKESFPNFSDLGIALTIIGSIGGIVSFIKLKRR